MKSNVLYKALSALWFSSLLSALFAFLLQVVLARSLSVEHYGMFASSFTILSMLIPLVGFGIAQYWLKVFGQNGIQGFDVVKPSLLVVLINLIIASVGVILWALYGPHDSLMQYVLLLLFFYLLGQVGGELLSTRFQLEERYLTLSLWQMFPSLIRLMAVVCMVFLLNDSISLIQVTWVIALIGVVVFVISLKGIWPMMSGKISLKGHGKGSDFLVTSPNQEYSPYKVQNVYRDSWPFALSVLFYLIYFQSDIIFIQYMVGEKEAGIYNVAFVILAAVLLFPGVVYQRFLLPKMHRWAYHDQEKFRQVFRVGNIVMLILGMMAMLAIGWVAPWLIPIAFGERFVDSLFLLSLLSFTIPVLFVASSYGSTLVTKDFIKTKVKLMGLVALINVVLNTALIPFYGSIGAAIATLLSNSLLLIFYMYANKKVFRFG